MKNKEYTHYTILKETENKISQPILIKQLSNHFSFNYIREQVAFLVKNEFIEREKINNRTFNLKITRKGKALRHALRIKLSLLNGVK